MIQKLHMSLIFSNLVASNIKLYYQTMCNLYAKFVKILEICKHFSGNLVNEKGNVPRRGVVPKFSDLEVVALTLAAETESIDSENWLFEHKLNDCRDMIPNLISRRPDSLSFANPGDMRPGLRTALSGGTSDARNATIMKMFGLLDFGERAGSGIPDLFDICNSELGTQPDYDVTYAPARTTLTIDTSKMARTKRTIKADGKVIMDDNDKADDKRTIKADDKRTIIIEYIHRNGEAKTEDLVKLLSSSTTRIKMLLYQLVDEGILVSCGGNRNRTYKLKGREQS